MFLSLAQGSFKDFWIDLELNRWDREHKGL
jgi:hypothetical protein